MGECNSSPSIFNLQLKNLLDTTTTLALFKSNTYISVCYIWRLKNLFNVHAHIDRQSCKTLFTIYESIDEWNAYASDNNCTLKDLPSCKAGDWIMADNGYYLPVIKTWIHETPKMFLKTIGVPRQYIKAYQYKSTGAWKKCNFIYERDRKEKPKAFLTARDKFFVRLFLNGMSFDDAYKTVYNSRRYKNKTHREMLLHRIADSDAFDKYLKENIVDIKDGFSNAGLNAEWLAKKLMETLDDPKAPSNLKISALQSVHSVLSLPDKNSTNTIKATSEDYMDEISKKSGLKIAGSN